MQYHKTLYLGLLFLLIFSFGLKGQIKIKEGVYELSFFGQKEYMQIYYNADTLNFIKVNNRRNNLIPFYSHPKKKLVFDHNSKDVGKARMKFKNNDGKDPDELKFKIKKLIWMGFKTKWISGFEDVDNDLNNRSNRIAFLHRNYTKSEHYVSMRDGTKLFTQIYTPKNTKDPRPAILVRTPYGNHPYGNEFKANILPSYHFAKEKYILVYQDIRGQFMSEGEFRQVTPLLKSDEKGTDEATDTFDTVDWLISKLENHNGNVGVHGISYDGYLASVAATCGHPSIKAVSSQAPMADGFRGDDFRRNGALYLNHIAYYLYAMGRGIENPGKQFPKKMEPNLKDAYSLFLKYKSLNTITDSLFDYKCNWWNDILAHEANDEYWQSRSINSYANKINVPLLNVGGWYDAEDLNGPLITYQLAEKQDKTDKNFLVVGPWTHGGWSSNGSSIDKVGNFSFDGTSFYFENNIEKDFFNFYLDKSEELDIPEATIYDTGNKQWNELNSWPPKNVEVKKVYFKNDNALSFDVKNETSSTQFDEFISDPNNPVPYTEESKIRYNKNYFTEDQRFNAERADILTYTSQPLKEDITVAGKIIADLFVSTTGTDSDWIVKVIDVLSEDSVAGYELLVRGDIIRGKFRNSTTDPEPFVPNQITNVKWELPDVLHTFKKGHKIKIQVQSSWFPLYDLNPQQFCDISEANEKDFKEAIQRVYRSNEYKSGIMLPILKKNK